MSSIPDPNAFNDNDKGHLTSSQAISLLPAISMCILLLVASAGFASVPIHDFVVNRANIKFVFDAMSSGLVSLALLVIGLLYGIPRVIDLARRQVHHIDGIGTRMDMTGVGKGGNGVFYLIGKTQFRMSSRKALKTLPQYISVRGYYTPLSKSLVNVKPLERQNPSQKAD